MIGGKYTPAEFCVLLFDSLSLIPFFLFNLFYNF
jgi:hypothetical protein